MASGAMAIQTYAEHTSRMTEASAGTVLVVGLPPRALAATLMKSLEQRGCEVIQASDVAAAQDVLRSTAVELIVVDEAVPEVGSLFQRVTPLADLAAPGIIVLTVADRPETAVWCLELGAEDYLTTALAPAVMEARLLAALRRRLVRREQRDFLEQIAAHEKRVQHLLDAVVPIGVALSSERDFERLLERILIEAKALCCADGGTLYLRDDHECLVFAIMRTDSLGLTLGGTSGRPITYPPIPLYEESGAPNEHNVVSYAVLHAATVNLADVYSAPTFDFSGTQHFDSITGYRTVSVLTVPLKSAGGRVVGALQLLNAQDPSTNQVAPFDADAQRTVESLSLLAVVALEGYMRDEALKRHIERLTIHIDQTKRAEEVADITGTDYFRALQQRASRLRLTKHE